MDTPLHALAVPDADPSTLKRPAVAAREFADAIANALPEGELSAPTLSSFAAPRGGARPSRGGSSEAAR
jgi:hypothetical protein